MRVESQKSTTTLLTNDTHEHKHIPQVYINNSLVPHTPTTKILGVTYDTSMTFGTHIADIKRRSQPRINTLRALTSTSFGQSHESLAYVYKTCIRTMISYASPARAPCTSTTHINTLQTIQNSALRIITGWTYLKKNIRP